MCAIFGSKEQSMFEVLLEANKARGNFASSLVTLMKNPAGQIDDVTVRKEQGVYTFEKLKLSAKKHVYYMGHVQAPTSSARTYNYDTSHPFEQEDWLIFHNGVLTNHECLNAVYCKWNENPVDTSVISCMLQEKWNELKDNKARASSTDEVKIIETICKRLQGTFALCIVNTTSLNVYLTRQGSTLYYDSNGNFSSIKGKTMDEVPEGKILKLTKDFTFKPVGKFTPSSPFLIV
jgi:glucosamine 6-phosphate synthetase-like amidotransferase/phosphosugar isomerase protein